MAHSILGRMQLFIVKKPIDITCLYGIYAQTLAHGESAVKLSFIICCGSPVS